MVARNIIFAAQGGLDEVHQRFVAMARAEHAKVMRTDPRPTRFERYVDGKLGVPESAVRPNGVITYLYPRLPIVVQYAMELLFKFSPVKSGAYREAHTIFLNGQAVSDLSMWKPGDEVVIINSMPYARKIELGAMKMTISGTSQVYEQAVSATNRKYRAIAMALHTWRGVVGGGAVNPNGAAPTVVSRTIVRGSNGRFLRGTRSVRVSGGAHNAANLRFPAIVFREV